MSTDTAAAERLPAAILGAASVAMVAITAWLIAGPWPAVCATLLFGILPEAVLMSRGAGLDALLPLVLLPPLLFGWLASRPPHEQGSHRNTSYYVHHAAAVAALLSFGVATLFFRASLVTAVAWITCILTFAAATFLLVRSRAALRNPGVQAAGLVMLCATAVALLLPELGREALTALHAGSRPLLARDAAATALQLARSLGWITPLLPVLVAISLAERPWLTVFLVLWSVLPIAVLLIADTNEATMRNMFVASVPSLFIVVGIALQSVVRSTNAMLAYHLRDWSISMPAAHRLAALAVAVILLSAAASLPGWWTLPRFWGE